MGIESSSGLGSVVSTGAGAAKGFSGASVAVAERGSASSLNFSPKPLFSERPSPVRSPSALAQFRSLGKLSVLDAKHNRSFNPFNFFNEFRSITRENLSSLPRPSLDTARPRFQEPGIPSFQEIINPELVSLRLSNKLLAREIQFSKFRTPDPERGHSLDGYSVVAEAIKLANEHQAAQALKEKLKGKEPASQLKSQKLEGEFNPDSKPKEPPSIRNAKEELAIILKETKEYVAKAPEQERVRVVKGREALKKALTGTETLWRNPHLELDLKSEKPKTLPKRVEKGRERLIRTVSQVISLPTGGGRVREASVNLQPTRKIEPDSQAEVSPTESSKENSSSQEATQVPSEQTEEQKALKREGDQMKKVLEGLSAIGLSQEMVIYHLQKAIEGKQDRALVVRKGELVLTKTQVNEKPIAQSQVAQSEEIVIAKLPELKPQEAVAGEQEVKQGTASDNPKKEDQKEEAKVEEPRVELIYQEDTKASAVRLKEAGKAVDEASKEAIKLGEFDEFGNPVVEGAAIVARLPDQDRVIDVVSKLVKSDVEAGRLLDGSYEVWKEKIQGIKKKTVTKVMSIIKDLKDRTIPVEITLIQTAGKADEEDIKRVKNYQNGRVVVLQKAA